ncbi:LysM peptidoglycan-binding domain-containing protein [Sunxiuqinia rutila]|uniref:PBP1 and LysM peptidoglycan-binding domain-containing protein n=1 Tax=Sunxiuqinia rutila TaxID=1397841 RepID=UPI003D35E925
MKNRIIITLLVFFLGFQLYAQERRIQEDGQTFLIHVVEKGETIFSLSKAYSVDRKDLLNANPSLIFGLKTGQELRIPVAESTETVAPKTEEQPQLDELPSFHSYRVKRKDALHFIAKSFNLEVADIVKYNPQLEEKGLKRGQTLLIPDANDLKRIRENREARRARAEQEVTAPVTKHRVVGDETLYSIAKKYNCSIADLIKANPKVKESLRIGMELTIPEKAFEAVTDVPAGEEFFIHLVESGETFWRLEREYHVTRDVLEKYNPALEHGLQAGLRIKIPVTEEVPDIQVAPVNEEAFTKHVVARGETLYSISNQYQVKITSIKKSNPVLGYRGLMAGETILIPNEVEAAPQPMVAEEALEEEEPEEMPREEAPARLQPLDYSVQVVAQERPLACEASDQARFKKYDVALLLPLYLEANDTVNRVRMTKEQMLQDADFMSQFASPEELPADTFKIRNEKIIYPRSENFVHFYEGVLLAVDSLQRAGMNVQLHVFDTNQKQAVVDSLIRLDVFQEVDLIIGPVFPELQGPVADFALRNQIPMVSPLSSAGDFETRNPWYFKINPTKDYLVRETADYIGEEYFNKNLIVLEMGEYKHLPEATLVDLCREKFFASAFLEGDRDVRFQEYNFSREGYWGLRRILSKTRENVFIIPSATEAQVSVAVSNINSLAEDYPVTLVGLSNFQRYNSIQPEYFHHTNLHLLSPYYINYQAPLTNRFVESFRRNFSAEPNQFSFQGYDVAYYFMSALFQYGENFTDCLPYHHVALNQAEFYFDRVSRYGGFMNRGLYILNYKHNYEIAVDGLEGIPSLLLTEE